jgi:hypothetical protein
MTDIQIQFAALCRKYGMMVGPLPQTLSGTLLLWAIGGCESSFGENTTPRLEPFYLHTMNGDMPAKREQFGNAAAMSYGPLQIMFDNAPTGATPDEFSDPDTAVAYSVSFLNKKLREYQPITLLTIACIWNAGSPVTNMSPGLAAYVSELEHNYSVIMP